MGFTVAWQDMYSKIVEDYMPNEIRLYKAGEKVYDVDTDEWISDPDEVRYEGKARVQPLRTTRWVRVPGNSEPVLTILFSIPISSDVVIDPGLFVDVVTSPLNPDLLRYNFITIEQMDSGNPLERTFYGVVNQENTNG